MVEVLKASGGREEFDRRKFLRSIMRGGSSKETAQQVLDYVQPRLHDGISTKEIFQLASERLSSVDTRGSLRYDLKNSMMRLGPSGFPFEDFIGAVLTGMGYEVSVRNVAHGRCVRHEIDLIAVSHGKATMVECKYHNYKGVFTGVKEAMYTYARLLDIREGYAADHMGAKIEKAMLVTNTKFSDDAITFANCRDIELLGWHHPERNGLERIIDSRRLYPITILHGLEGGEANDLARCGILLVRDLLRFDRRDISEKTGIPSRRLERLSTEARDLLG
ncbi:MAG TPA: restriction endonuclease [Conexivisphaerales archaeon]|nr:restriction endonuclease [Conexivisphaerales archaeon]